MDVTTTHHTLSFLLLGAVWNTCKVEIGSTVAVFGLGTVVRIIPYFARVAMEILVVVFLKKFFECSCRVLL